MDPRRIPWRIRHGFARRIASRWRQLVLRVTHQHATVRFGRGCYLGPGFHLTLPGGGSLVVGDDVEFRRGFTCEISGTGQVSIGPGTVFSYDSVIQCTTRVRVGARCLISRVMIADGNHRFRDPSRPVGEQGYDFRPVMIGDDVTLTANATVTASVGTHSLIGANSVVTEEIPPYSLAVGAPARVIEHYPPE